NEGYFTRAEGSTWEPEPGDFWCEFVLATAVEKDIIAERTLYLRGVATEFSGEFDGWACHVTS
ncbi:MAG: ribonuclease E inhibitor RraB, partial [Chlorobia bacterium]|nr:ribonuclease E inhibitor RraB [Fimbriimonadaceae bacterium]